MARKNTGDPIVDKLAKRKNMAGYELRSSYKAPKKETKQISGNVTPRRGTKVAGPDKDYSGRRNIWNQEKNKVTTRTKETDKRGKVTEKKITTKTRTISPKRTAVYTGGNVSKTGPGFPSLGYLIQEGKAKTVKTKRLAKVLEKHPEYKVADRKLKTKVREDVKTYTPGSKNAPHNYTTKKSKKGIVANARASQAKLLPKKIIHGLFHTGAGVLIGSGIGAGVRRLKNGGVK